MKVVIQRVSSANVKVSGNIVGNISKGILVFLSIAKTDTIKDADYLIRKITEIKIFEDENKNMNLSALEIRAEFLIVSQFTLHGNCSKGRRPSFDKSAEPKKAKELYDYFVEKFKKLNVKVETGQFAKMMKITLINNGPVTFIIDSEK